MFFYFFAPELLLLVYKLTIPDHNALVLSEALHVVIAGVSDGKDVWGQLSDLLTAIKLDLVHSVDGQNLVGVDSHQDGAGVGLWGTRKTWGKHFNTLHRRKLAEMS